MTAAVEWLHFAVGVLAASLIWSGLWIAMLYGWLRRAAEQLRAMEEEVRELVQQLGTYQARARVVEVHGQAHLDGLHEGDRPAAVPEN